MVQVEIYSESATLSAAISDFFDENGASGMEALIDVELAGLTWEASAVNTPLQSEFVFSSQSVSQASLGRCGCGDSLVKEDAASVPALSVLLVGAFMLLHV